MDLTGKKVILGITGSIAAYKAVYLLRYLIREGAEVQVLMTPSAKEFVSPLTFSALSGKPVLSDFFQDESGAWHSHVDLGIRSDFMLIAPVTATTLGKCANGIADNLLVTTYLSARCPVFFAPAMDMDMYHHPSTQNNLQKLQSFGNFIIEPSVGDLASGLEGKGRLAEPEEIIKVLKDYKPDPSKKKMTQRVLITAGPTHEKIDPVRFIGNQSSGKMGYAIAEIFAEHGAEVHLVSGPVDLKPRNPGIRLTRVTSAAEMYMACAERINDMDVAIFSAAVADFTPLKAEAGKIRSAGKNISIALKPTTDIAGTLGKHKRGNQVFVGFALETENEIKNASGKLLKKNFDLVVMNSLRDEGAGFGTDTNKVTFIDREGKIMQFDKKQKSDVARDIFLWIEKYIKDA